MKKNSAYNDLPPIKKLGQNFLIDDNIARKIVSYTFLRPHDVVIEIGPGRGALTHLLSKEVSKVFAYEIDKKLAQKLVNEFNNTNVEIKHEDFLITDLNEVQKNNLLNQKAIIVANLPYYISSKIILKILKSNIASKVIIMLQKEMAERITANPKSKQYNAFSVLIKLLSKSCKSLFLVPNTSFYPIPKVQSVVVEIEPVKNFEVDIDSFEKFIKKCFGQKRKTIFNNLKNFYAPNQVIEILKKLKIDPLDRPETIWPETYIKIYLEFDNYDKN